MKTSFKQHRIFLHPKTRQLHRTFPRLFKHILEALVATLMRDGTRVLYVKIKVEISEGKGGLCC